ncbi:MAG TPA: sulfotransferase [Dokdonella sp.]
MNEDNATDHSAARRPLAQSAAMGRTPPASMQRVFLLGCPRSGTTFLQAALSGHPAIASIPETAFFERTLPDRVDQEVVGLDFATANPRARRGREYLRIQRRARRALRRVARDLGLPPGRIGVRPGLAGYVGTFTRLLDSMAHSRGCSAWLEKTPSHVFYLDLIERYVPEARCIHLLRRGEDVIASAVEASFLYSRIGEGLSFCHGIPWWVAYWNAAVEMHRRYAGMENHHIVFYEDLMGDFPREFKRLCNFIGVAPLPPRLDAMDRITALDSEPWKQGALSGRLSPAESKFDTLFGPTAREWILEQLQPYEEVRASLGAR